MFESKKYIVFNNKEYIKLDKKLPNGGGSDEICVVLDENKYDEILNYYFDNLLLKSPTISFKIKNIK